MNSIDCTMLLVTGIALTLFVIVLVYGYRKVVNMDKDESLKEYMDKGFYGYSYQPNSKNQVRLYHQKRNNCNF